tara:strand:+ start:68 stop:406 length:339 start_codon:yes stop_codon:yes gene_type:complete
MKIFNESELEQEFACSAFKNEITKYDWTKEQLIDFLIQQKKSHIAERNILVRNLEIHGIIATLIHVENGGSNDVSWEMNYLNKQIEDAYKKHIQTRVGGYYMAKAISDSDKD